MTRYARGPRAWGISDRSGRRYLLSKMRKEWNGSIVGPDEFEEKHPQIKPRKVKADAIVVKTPRTDPEAGRVYAMAGGSVFPPLDNVLAVMPTHIGIVTVTT